MAESSTNLKESDNQIQEAQRVSNKMKPKQATTRHIINSKVKDKERILDSIKQLVAYKGTPLRLSADSQQKFCRSEVAEYNQNGERKKPSAIFYSTQPGYLSHTHI